jgi:hypothetical protein
MSELDNNVETSVNTDNDKVASDTTEVKIETEKPKTIRDVVAEAWAKSENSNQVKESEETESVVETNTEDVKTEKIVEDDIKIPQYATKELRDAWSNLPKEAKQAIKSYDENKENRIRNEQQRFNQTQQELLKWKEVTKEHELYSQLNPNEQRKTIKALLETDKLLRNNPIEAIIRIAERNKIDLTELVAGDKTLAHDARSHSYEQEMQRLAVQNARLEAEIRAISQNQVEVQQSQVDSLLRAEINNLDPQTKSLLTNATDGGNFLKTVQIYAHAIELASPEKSPVQIFREALSDAQIKHGIQPAVHAKASMISNEQRLEKARSAQSIKSTSSPQTTARPVFTDLRSKVEHYFNLTK